jgi:nickel/cobalt transporter (NiCoT) family protein
MGSPLHTEIALLALVFVLGLRHGLDPDHLVAIDGLTRSNGAPWTGVFFSLGHGVVVTLVGVALALAASEWQPPAWLEISGTVISVGMLFLLGIANLRAPPGSPLVSVRGRWLAARLAGASHPVIIAAIGAAFALSFDTLSHALLFSATGATAAGWLFALGLGLVFTLGMMLADTIDGWLVARMAVSTRNSRVMAYAVAALCFLVAVLGLAKFVRFGLGDWAALAGIGTLAFVAAAWLLARRPVAA